MREKVLALFADPIAAAALEARLASIGLSAQTDHSVCLLVLEGQALMFLGAECLLELPSNLRPHSDAGREIHLFDVNKLLNRDDDVKWDD